MDTNPFTKLKMNSDAIVISTFKNMQALTSIVCTMSDLEKALEYLKEAKGDQVTFLYLEEQIQSYKLPLNKDHSDEAFTIIDNKMREFWRWR